MENGNSSFLVCFSLGTFFLLLLNHASAESRTEPRLNANLSPFESWRSAYFCMLNTSKFCSSKGIQVLTLTGLLNVQDSDISDFCSGGCCQHTLSVIQCIQDVKRDFKFATQKPLYFVRNAIVKACSERKGFNTNYTEPDTDTRLNLTLEGEYV